MAAAEILYKTWRRLVAVAGGWWCAGDAMQRMLSQLLQMMYGMSVQTAAGETRLTAALQISTVCSDRNLAATSFSHFSSAVVPTCQLSS